MPLCKSVPKRATDLTGKRFGHWFVVGYAGIRSSSRVSLWHGICLRCGASATRDGSTLVTCHAPQCCRTRPQRIWSIDSFKERLSNTETMSKCWEWQGSRSHDNYGLVTSKAYKGYAHRLSWILHCGPMIQGNFVLHRCDNPPCCNPSHLFLGSKQDNARDAVAKGRQALGSRNGQSKLSESDVIEILRLLSVGISQPRIAAGFGISTRTVSKINTGTRWKHLQPANFPKPADKTP
jgi:hypothetical protein